MDETTINGKDVQLYDKDAFSDYRSQWTRKEDTTEVDLENKIAPQYEKHFPPAGEYPSEVYENCACIPIDELDLSIGDEIVFWNGPPCNENSYLKISTVQNLPPVEFHRIGKPSIMSDDHVTCHNGQPVGNLLGPIRNQVRIDCIVKINP